MVNLRYVLKISDEEREILNDFLLESEYWYTVKRLSTRELNNCILFDNYIHNDESNKDFYINLYESVLNTVDAIDIPVIIDKIGWNSNAMFFGVENNSLHSYLKEPIIIIGKFSNKNDIGNINKIKWHNLNTNITLTTTLQKYEY